MSPSRARSDGLRLTKVGLWFGLFALIAALAAFNTGNNGLYMVLAVMLGVLVVGQGLGGLNVRRLVVTLEPPDELCANTPARFRVRLENEGRWLARWWLAVAVESEDVELEAGKRRSTAAIVPRVGPGATAESTLELMLSRRGRRRVRRVRVASLYPFGFFRKGVRHPVDLDVLVYPELFVPDLALPALSARLGDELSLRAGWGHDLHALRPFRPGDDPRGVHWKHTARVGEMVFKERRAEEARRLTIALDNGIGVPTADERQRFERLVSEAATAAVGALEDGFEVEVWTRDGHVPFGKGGRQRRAILELLALVEPVPRQPGALVAPGVRSIQLHLALPEREAAA